MKVVVNINLRDDSGRILETKVKKGTVSNIRSVHQDETYSLELYNFIPQQLTVQDNFQCWNTILRSYTQLNQYFVIVWANIPQTKIGGALWPLMVTPNASVFLPGASANGKIVCNWWNWNDSPAVGRQLPYPNPVPEYNIIVGSITSDADAYTLTQFNDSTYPTHPVGNYNNAEAL
jgi:hypothetical protein